MANHRKTLEEFERFYGEPIEVIVVGKHDDRSFDEQALPDENVILSREAGLAKIDEEYDNSYGGADCFPFYAWTASRVFFVHEYDGATSIVWAPRAPLDIDPQFGGQSPAFDYIDRAKAEKTAA